MTTNSKMQMKNSEYRGYAHLGIGAYIINHSSIGAENGAELCISIATEEEKKCREIGSLKDNPEGAVLHPEDMVVRLKFENVAGLNALEAQLALLRSVHFCNPAMEQKP